MINMMNTGFAKQPSLRPKTQPPTVAAPPAFGGNTPEGGKPEGPMSRVRETLKFYLDEVPALYLVGRARAQAHKKMNPDSEETHTP
jgi:hypothetical protein